MFNFLKKSLTIAAGIISMAFTFIPETFFAKLKLFEKASEDVNIIVNHALTFGVVTIFVFLIYGTYLHFRKHVKINGRNYDIEVLYGDIFEMPNCKKVITFDECFTTAVGNAPAEIKPKSICGQYLKRYPVEDIQALIDKAQLKPLRNKSQYKNKERYESGRIIPNGDFLLTAFAKLDKDGLGRMTRDELIDCLSLLWKEIDKHYGQTDICVPVLGAGITRLDDTSLTQQELLDIIICSYKLSTQKIKKPYKLYIVCKETDDFSLNKIGSYM